MGRTSLYRILFRFLNNFIFNSCSKSNPLTHAGNLKLIWLTGNSYKMFENIFVISVRFKFSQFIGITVQLYFWLNLSARLIVSELSGCSEFKRIIKGLLIAFNSKVLKKIDSSEWSA